MLCGWPQPRIHSQGSPAPGDGVEGVAVGQQEASALCRHGAVGARVLANVGRADHGVAIGRFKHVQTCRRRAFQTRTVCICFRFIGGIGTRARAATKLRLRLQPEKAAWLRLCNIIYCTTDRQILV